MLTKISQFKDDVREEFIDGIMKATILWRSRSTVLKILHTTNTEIKW